MNEPLRAFVLAAGFGTRLRPLTEELPKPAWPLFDVPLAAYVLFGLAAAGVAETVVNLHHLGAELQTALAPWVPPGMTIRWSPEEVILGTGGALEPWQPFLREKPFFLCNADTYQEIDFAGMLRFHRERRGVATLSVRRVSGAAPLEVDEGGRIMRFLGAQARGSTPGHPCEFTGVHMLEPEVLDALPGGPCCINADVHAKLVARGLPLFGYEPPTPGFWSDLGTPERYLAAHAHFLRYGRLPSLSRGRLVLEDGPDGAGGLLLAPSYVGVGARVEAGSVAGPLAVLGAGSVVAGGARVAESVLWPRSVVAGREARGAVVSPSGGWLCGRNRSGESSHG